jgi:hypothetical protein
MSSEIQAVPLEVVPPWRNSGNSILGSHLGTTDYLLTKRAEFVPASELES